MRRKKTYLAAAAAAVTVAGAGAGVAAASSDDGDTTEVPITGSTLEDVSRLALDHTGGGRVTGTEVGDEEGYYEVEVTLHDGSQVDVHLSQELDVLGDEGDGADEETGHDD